MIVMRNIITKYMSIITSSLTVSFITTVGLVSLYLLEQGVKFEYAWILLECVSMCFIFTSYRVNTKTNVRQNKTIVLKNESLLVYMIPAFMSFSLLLITVIVNRAELESFSLYKINQLNNPNTVILENQIHALFTLTIFIGLLVKVGMVPAIIYVSKIVQGLDRWPLIFYLIITKFFLLIVVSKYIHFYQVYKIAQILCIISCVIAPIMLVGYNNIKFILVYSGVNTFSWVLLIICKHSESGDSSFAHIPWIALVYLVSYSLAVALLMYTLPEGLHNLNLIFHKKNTGSGGWIFMHIAIIIVSGLPPFLLFGAKAYFIKNLIYLNTTPLLVLTLVLSSALVSIIFIRIVLIAYKPKTTNEVSTTFSLNKRWQGQVLASLFILMIFGAFVLI